MWNKLLSPPLLYLFLLIGTIVATVAGIFLQNKFLLPLLQIAVAYPVLYALLIRRLRKRAIAAMLFWALCLGVVTVATCVRFPDEGARSIVHGSTYTNQMFQWIKTGEGAEGNPLQFVPQHLIHFVVFVLLSLLTGSLLSLLMGALLMNYMSFYVSSVILASNDRLMGALMGWHPWSVIRVASFVILGVILAEPMICRIQKMDYEYAEVRPFFWAALNCLVVDILMKTFLAPWWGLELRRLIS